MRLYHGGLVEVGTPRVLASGRVGDFGAGFHATTDFEQARRFVGTECDRAKVPRGAISIYEVPDGFLSMASLDVRIFREADEEWARFVLANRRDAGFVHGYNVVMGPVANDQVYASFVLFENELIDFSELIARLKVRRLTDQVLFHSERSLRLLGFMESEEISCRRK